MSIAGRPVWLWKTSAAAKAWLDFLMLLGCGENGMLFIQYIIDNFDKSPQIIFTKFAIHQDEPRLFFMNEPNKKKRFLLVLGKSVYSDFLDCGFRLGAIWVHWQQPVRFSWSVGFGFCLGQEGCMKDQTVKASYESFDWAVASSG